MIVCKSCGNQEVDSTSFCGVCGAFLEWEGERMAEPAQGPGWEVPDEEELRKRGIVTTVKEVLGLDHEEQARLADEAARKQEASAEREASETAAAAAEEHHQARTEAEIQARAAADAEERARNRAAVADQARVEAEAALAAASDAESRATAAASAETNTRLEASARASQAAAADDEEARQAAEAQARAAEIAAAQARAQAAAEAQARADAELRRQREVEEAERAAAAAEREAQARHEAEARAATAAEEEAKAKAEAEERLRRAAALVAPRVPEAPKTRRKGATAQGGGVAGGAAATGPVAGAGGAGASGAVGGTGGSWGALAGPGAAAGTSQPGPVEPGQAQPEAVLPGMSQRRQRLAHQTTAARKPQPGDLICGQCGGFNSPERKFCRRCGSSLAEAQSVHVSWWRRLLRWFKHLRHRTRAVGSRPSAGKQQGTGPGGVTVGVSKLSSAWKRSKRWIKTILALVIAAIIILALVPGTNFIKTERQKLFGEAKTLTGKPVLLNTAAAFTNHLVSAVASSQIAGHSATEAINLTNNIAWISAPDPSKGVDQSVTASFTQAQTVDRVGIISGAYMTAFDTYARPRDVAVTFYDHAGKQIRKYEKTLSDVSTFQQINVKVKDVSKIQVLMLAVYPGTGDNGVAIASLQFFQIPLL